ncbi:hypothetical protein DB30_07002 [Enhygromyxa salina]|uniref:Uncharacterized protein n=1 Tax=Enhygromyxa salina TaxID=215803 RepID=A0A0C1ZTA2_9BACT|nr:hypothetical protein DB30_07002 [Enhygromyxa salina]
MVEFGSKTRVSIAGGIEITIQAGAVLAHASLAAQMSVATREQLDLLISRALTGDEAALREVEVLLPIARGQVRTHLAATPNAVGAAALRLILVGYEE